MKTITAMKTNQRIVFYVTEAEKMTLDRISEETGARVSELMRRAFKQWLEGAEGGATRKSRFHAAGGSRHFRGDRNS